MENEQESRPHTKSEPRAKTKWITGTRLTVISLLTCTEIKPSFFDLDYKALPKDLGNTKFKI